ncbi:MAG: aquaporin, partial [Clostridia bacterium]|nr:aquaporin [Clostridia bacterium]
MEKECDSFKKYFAEMIGTMTLVLFGCGVAVYTGGSVVATALAFGLSLIAMSFVVGQVSGCHLNPAVSLALFINKRLSFKDLIGYMLAQFLGATVACLELMLLFGRNQSYGANVMQNAITSTHGDAAAIWVAIVAELIMTFVFVISLL